MIVYDTKVVAGLGLASIEIIGDCVKLNFKNNSTFTLSPEIDDCEVIKYNMNFITGKENKKINKLQNKVDNLLNQIQTLTEEGDGDNSTEDSSEYVGEEVRVEEI